MFWNAQSQPASLPAGVILLWSGSISTIPAGFRLCNGNNGTPNLLDKFIVGARSDAGGIAKTLLTGALTQSGGKNSHTHSASFTGGGTAAASGFMDNVAAGSDFESSPQVHTHSLSISGGGSTTAPIESGTSSALPPYYALAYIMKL